MKRGFGLLGLAVCLGGQLWAMPVFGAEELGLTTPQTPEATPLVVEASPAVEVTPGQPVQLDPGAPTPAVSQSSTEPAPQLPTPGTMQIEAQNPQTGEKI